MPKFMRSHDDAGETAGVLDDGHAVHLVTKVQRSEDGEQQRKKTKAQRSKDGEQKSIDHLLKTLVDNTSTSHIGKACSSSVAVTALCLSSEGKCKFEEKRIFFVIHSKIVDKSPGAVIALPLPLKVRWGHHHHPRGYICAQGTLTIH